MQRPAAHLARGSHDVLCGLVLFLFYFFFFFFLIPLALRSHLARIVKVLAADSAGAGLVAANGREMVNHMRPTHLEPSEPSGQRQAHQPHVRSLIVRLVTAFGVERIPRHVLQPGPALRAFFTFWVATVTCCRRRRRRGS